MRESSLPHTRTFVVALAVLEAEQFRESVAPCWEVRRALSRFPSGRQAFRQSFPENTLETVQDNDFAPGKFFSKQVNADEYLASGLK